MENRAGYRPLTKQEIDILTQQGNSAEDWTRVNVKEGFEPHNVHHCRFEGEVLIGRNGNGSIGEGSLVLAVGLYHSFLSDCRIGNQCAIHHARYIHNYQIGDGVMIFSVDQISAGKKPGCGFAASIENSSALIYAGNENGGRSFLPFPGMLPADAQLYSQYGLSQDISKKLKAFSVDEIKKWIPNQAYIADSAILLNSHTITDSYIGSHANLKEMERCDNCTIFSSGQEPTIVETGVILSNSVIGFANHIARGVNADHIFTCRNVKLENGLRIFHTFISPNSTLACGEVSSTLLLPFHEQHHNNSFLIASTLLGQSNIAAGATIGSNHNSRAADGEIRAERGFWPGLCSTFKHNCLFAPFTLVAKGNYDAELNITLPFSLVSLDPADHTVQIMPGFWFKYNMYALERNRWKFAQRDRRLKKEQIIETDFLAPDTVSIMKHSIFYLLELLSRHSGNEVTLADVESGKMADKPISAEGMVNKQSARILKPVQGILLYKQTVELFITREITLALQSHSREELMSILTESLADELDSWINLGGQVLLESELEEVTAAIRKGNIQSWQEIHNFYTQAAEHSQDNRLRFAIKCLHDIYPDSRPDQETVNGLLQRGIHTLQNHLQAVLSSRQKDYSTPFRSMMYADEQEMRTVLGSPEEDPFIADYKKHTQEWINRINNVF